jgi:hypothetical protein
LKLYDGQTMYEGKTGASFVDMDQKFRWINFDQVVEL